MMIFTKRSTKNQILETLTNSMHEGGLRWVGDGVHHMPSFEDRTSLINQLEPSLLVHQSASELELSESEGQNRQLY